MSRRHCIYHSERTPDRRRQERLVNIEVVPCLAVVIELFWYWIISHDFVLDSCTKDPALCLNGGTCEVTMTGTRCRCTDRYQGDRCDRCSERFQGDSCQECADGYHGDSCSVSINFESVQTVHQRDHSGGIILDETRRLNRGLTRQ